MSENGTRTEPRHDTFYAPDGHGGRKPVMSKAERYKWKDIGKPGEFAWVDKSVLNVDREYQRNANDARATAIASDFSWPLFGVCSVARRPDGTLWIFDAQHRWFGAMKRADVTKVPCMIHDVEAPTEEAVAFLGANTFRGVLNSTERFKAQLKAGDKYAVVIDELVRECGRKIDGTTSKNSVRCIGLLMRLARQDMARLRRIWPVIIATCNETPVYNEIVAGLYYIEQHAVNASLTEPRWREPLENIGAEALLAKARIAAQGYDRGGDKRWAFGILLAINHRKKHKLQVAGLSLVNDESE